LIVPGCQGRAGRELDLELPECHGEPLDDGNVAADFRVFMKHKSKVVNQEVALVLATGNMHGVSENAITGGGADADKLVARFLFRNDEFGDSAKVKERRGRRRGNGFIRRLH